MADRFVNGQEQLRRVDHDVVGAGRDRFRFQFLDRFMSGLLGVGQPRIVLHVLVADQLRAIDDGPRLEVAAGAIGGGRRELRIGADEPLGDPRSVGRGEELLFVDEQQLRVDEAHARHGQRRLVELHQECRLGVERHVERVALEGAGPRGNDFVGVGQDDLARGEPGVRARDGDGLFRRNAGRGRLDAVRRGEAPGAVHEDAQRRGRSSPIARRSGPAVHAWRSIPADSG